MSKVKWLGQREVSVDNTKIAPPAAIIPTAPVRPSTRTSAASTFRTVSTPSAEETNWPLIAGVAIGLGVLGYVLIKGAKEIGLRDNPDGLPRGYKMWKAQAPNGRKGWAVTTPQGWWVLGEGFISGNGRTVFRSQAKAKAAAWDVFRYNKTVGLAKKRSKLDDNPSAIWKRFPKTIGKLTPSGFDPKLPVLRVEAFPPGAHPKEGSAIRKDVTVVVAHTQYGPRYFGFAEAYIDSRLTMVAKLLPGQERDEVIAKWQTVKGRG